MANANGTDTFTGALGDLLSGRTDLIMNTFFIKDYGSDRLRFTVQVYVDRLCIVVRAAELVSWGGGGNSPTRFRLFVIRESGQS